MLVEEIISRDAIGADRFEAAFRINEVDVFGGSIGSDVPDDFVDAVVCSESEGVEIARQPKSPLLWPKPALTVFAESVPSLAFKEVIDRSLAVRTRQHPVRGTPPASGIGRGSVLGNARCAAGVAVSRLTLNRVGER